MRHLIIGSAALLLCACATSQDDLLGDMFAPVSASKIVKVEAAAAKAGAPLGSEANPVRASMPPGQRAYLERLRCSDGNAPQYVRGGSVGEGPFGKIMDVYQLKCPGAQPAAADVYMDMYHDHVEQRAVPGFTIQPQ